jgi:tetratricopeptide (TPR) repeat protein
LDDYIRGRTLNSRALFCITLGRLEEALAGHQACLDLWRQLGNRLREGLALLNLGILAYELRRYDQAESNLAEAARCFEEVEAPEQLASVQNERGLVYRDLGRWEEALACFEAAAPLIQALIDDQPVEPGCKARVTAELDDSRKQLEKDLLGQVPGLRFVTCKTKCQ